MELLHSMEGCTDLSSQLEIVKEAAEEDVNEEDVEAFADRQVSFSTLASCWTDSPFHVE